MKFEEPEVLELGEAGALIQETLLPGDEEGFSGYRTRNQWPIYLSEGE